MPRRKRLAQLPLEPPILTVLIGMPGSGKTTYAAQHFPPPAIISIDACWERCYSATGGEHMFWTLLETQLSRNTNTVTDRTALDASTRARLLYRGHQHGYQVHAVLLDPPYSVAVYRDSQRETPFPPAVLHRCHEKVVHARSTILDEGFDRVTILTG